VVGAATENERRPIVERRCAGTCKDIVIDERSRWRPGKSATRTRSSKYGGANPCSTRYASTETLKYMHARLNALLLMFWRSLNLLVYNVVTVCSSYLALLSRSS